MGLAPGSKRARFGHFLTHLLYHFLSCTALSHSIQSALPAHWNNMTPCIDKILLHIIKNHQCRLRLSVLQYMQFVEDYSEPQPSMFYQMPQSESIYEQRNKRFQEVYGFNDSFSSTDSVHEPVQPPALPPKQRQLVRNLWVCPAGDSSFADEPKASGDCDWSVETVVGEISGQIHSFGLW